MNVIATLGTDEDGPFVEVELGITDEETAILDSMGMSYDDAADAVAEQALPMLITLGAMHPGTVVRLIGAARLTPDGITSDPVPDTDAMPDARVSAPDAVPTAVPFGWGSV
jgi:hypothetical protein